MFNKSKQELLKAKLSEVLISKQMIDKAMNFLVREINSTYRLINSIKKSFVCVDLTEQIDKFRLDNDLSSEIWHILKQYCLIRIRKEKLTQINNYFIIDDKNRLFISKRKISTIEFYVAYLSYLLTKPTYLIIYIVVYILINCLFFIFS